MLAASHHWVNAVAGSGKTRFITEHLSSLRGNVLCLSFSRSAVKKMHNKAQHHVDTNATFCTIHSLASTISPQITCDAQADRIVWDIMWQCLSPELKRNIGELEQQYPGWREVVDLHNSTPQDTNAQHFARIKAKVVDHLATTRGITSYDNLLRTAITSLKTQPMLNPPQHILIDEAQDLTDLQWQLISAVFDESMSSYQNPTITVVGDPNQIIYSFQGSSVDVWNKWYSWWCNLSGVTQTKQSTICYRCGNAILDVVNQLFTPVHLSQRAEHSWITLDINPATTHECAKQITEYINHLVCTHQAKLDQILILAKRRGVLSNAIIKGCAENKIPLSGLSTDIGTSIDTIQLFFAAATQPSDSTLFATLKILHNNTQMHQRIKQRAGSVAGVIKQYYPDLDQLLQTLKTNDIGRFIYTLKQHTTLDPALIKLAAMYCAETMGHTADFVEYCKTQRAASTEAVPGHARLLTIHAAKGLQSKYVIIADAHEGPYKILRNHYIQNNITHTASPGNLEERRKIAREESKNLLYVALTRAEQGVLLCGPGKVAPDSFADLVYDAISSLGTQPSDGVISWEI